MFLVFVVPYRAWAHDLSISDLFPFGWWGPLVACDGEVCTNLCQVLDLVQHLIYFGLSLLIFAVTPIMILVGGGMIMMSRGEEMLSKGKKIVTGTVIGLAIGLSGFVIISTFLWIVGNNEAGTLPDGSPAPRVSWPDIQCQVEAFQLLPRGGTGAAGAGGVDVVAGVNDHETILNELDSRGIAVRSTGGCSDINNPRCTSLTGLPRSAVTGLEDVKSQCGCDLTVTGGTEVGHETHGPGKAIVDLAITPSTNAFILSEIGTSNPQQNTWYLGARDGVHYFYEGDHWHACFDLADCPHRVPG